MGEIILVRHGQANSAADNEDDYDKLSDLGHQQAKWLGEWMRTHGLPRRPPRRAVERNCLLRSDRRDGDGDRPQTLYAR